jgi:hypothetical protein
VEQFALDFDLAPERRIYTVSELNSAIAEVPGTGVSVPLRDVPASVS